MVVAEKLSGKLLPIIPWAGGRGREQGAGRNLSVRMSWAVHWAWRRAGAALSTCLNKKYLQTSRLMRLEVTQLLAPVNKSEIPL